MIQTWSNARASKNNCLVVDEDRLHVATLAARDLPDAAELHDLVPDVILERVHTTIPLTRVTAIRLGLKSNELHVNYLSGRQFKNDDCLLVLASTDAATAVFSAIQSKLGEGFRTQVEERTAMASVRGLLAATLCTLMMYGVALAVEHSPEDAVQPARVLMALAFAAMFTYRLTQADNREYRDLLTLLSAVTFGLMVAVFVTTEVVLVLGAAVVLCCFFWLLAQLAQVEKVAVVRKLPGAVPAEKQAPTEIVPWNGAPSHHNELTELGLSSVEDGEEDTEPPVA